LPTNEIFVPQKHPLLRLQWISGGIGILALAAALFLGMSNAGQFYFSYLVSYLFVLTLAVGALGFVLIQFVTRAGWSVAVRRTAEHIMGTIPFLLVLSIPALLGFEHLFSWADAEKVANDPLLQGKQPYLNPVFFYLRTAVFLLSWAAISYWFRKRSVAQDDRGGSQITRTLQTVSAPAIAWFAVSLTFFSFDWIMSLDPHWYSTVFGVYIFGGSFMGALALIILLVLILQRGDLLTNLVNSEHLHDLGKLMFGFVVFWAYIGFSQFMLIWYANIPEETIWYAHRLSHGWEFVSVLLAVGHFVIPFFVLISRTTKRNRLVLVGATVWLLFMHYVDLYWLVMPVHSEGFHPHMLDLLALVGVGGLFLAVLIRLMVGPALVPTRDPRLAESLSFENM
jgi:hypothetical protein